MHTTHTNDRDYADELRATVDAAAERLLAVEPAAAARRPPRGGWSAKEVVGHLVDSAANDLWRDHNRHLARVMAAVPSDVRHRERARHNLHDVAWQPVPADRPATLDYSMRDHVEHLRHHLRQIHALLGPEAAP